VTLWVFYFFFEVESTCNHPWWTWS
jgi:hypothetical protein